jgi:nicotinamide mononucleotide transporter
MIAGWIADNIIEIFGAVTGIAYVILEIKRNILLWPLGIITSAVYIYVFGRNGFYANMGLQWYYLLISIYGWYKWQGAGSMEQGARSMGQGAGKGRALINDPVGHLSEGASLQGRQEASAGELTSAKKEQYGSDIRRIDSITAVGSGVTALLLWSLLWYVLDRWTDSPVPLWDGLIASLSVVATWMLTKKILEQWYVWIVADAIAVIVYLGVGLYPTAVLFAVYTVMALLGLRAWSMEQGRAER